MLFAAIAATAATSTTTSIATSATVVVVGVETVGAAAEMASGKIACQCYSIGQQRRPSNDET